MSATRQHWHPCSCGRGQPTHTGKVWGPPSAFPPPKMNDTRSKTCLVGVAHKLRDASSKKAAEKAKEEQAQMAVALAALNTDE